MAQSQLYFRSAIGKQKPESIINRTTACPFCDRSSLEGILDQHGSMILLKNKFPVLEDAFQTVLIETDECDSELSLYSRDHLHALMAFGVEKWLEMEASKAFTSVMFFKNHGPYSGGSIRHPHMQIVGLETLDCLEHTNEDHFEGVVIAAQHGVTCNISTMPRIGFFEFNVILTDFAYLNAMADYIQVLTHFILHHFNQRCASYNLFFYHIHGNIMVKVVPRFVTSPLFVGYGIPQVANNLEEVAARIRGLYF